MSNIEKLAELIPQGADPFKVAKYLALRGERVLPFVLSEFGQIVPDLIRQDRSAWWGATSDLEIIEQIGPRFRLKGTKAGIALGTPQQPFFMYWDGKSFQQIGSSEPEKPKPPVSFSEFEPAHPPEQKGEAYSRFLDHSHQLHKLEDQKRALIQRVASLQAERQAYDRLQADRDELESRISMAEAEALISGQSADLKDDLEKSSVLSKEVRKTKRLADANRIATKMLQRDIAKLDSLLETQREAVNRAKETWVETRRAFICDELRKNLHNMSPIVAELLATERIGSFRVDYGWKFIDAMANPTIQYFGIKPDWADIPTNERFPGFLEAVAALRAELNGELDMGLPALWKAFRRQRRAELEAEGFSKHDARHLAHNEAKNRAKGEPLVGRDAALSAGIWTDYRADGTCGTYLVVPEDSVPASFLPKAKAWAAMPHSAVQ